MSPKDKVIISECILKKYCSTATELVILIHIENAFLSIFLVFISFSGEVLIPGRNCVLTFVFF